MPTRAERRRASVVAGMGMRPILDCMAEGLDDLAGKFKGKRQPKAFYLGPDDWADFMATNPPTISTTFKCEPALEPGFRDIPVRQSLNVPPRQSRLYDSTSTGRPIRPAVKRDPNRIILPELADIEPAVVFAALDQISRARALTEHESLALEAVMKGRVIITKREAARLGIKRSMRP